MTLTPGRLAGGHSQEQQSRGIVFDLSKFRILKMKLVLSFVLTNPEKCLPTILSKSAFVTLRPFPIGKRKLSFYRSCNFMIKMLT
jgi:hypothetical protein